MTKKTVSIEAHSHCGELLSFISEKLIGKSVFEVKKSIMPDNSSKKDIDSLQPNLQIIGAVVETYGLEFELIVKYDPEKNKTLGKVEVQENPVESELSKQAADINPELKPEPTIIEPEAEPENKSKEDDVPDFD